MILKEKGYAYNDLTIVPEKISRVKSRSECNPFCDNQYLPIFTAPMTSVVSDKNYELFESNKINAIIPRNINLSIRKNLMNNNIWTALSLNEFKSIFIDSYKELIQNKTYKICIDIANGHMSYLYDICLNAKKLSIENNYELIIMTGNIANPDTYEWLCKFNEQNNYKIIEYIRVGIGGGSGCITTSNTSCHYPQASLIDECYKHKKYYLNYTYKDICPKIIADGGIRNYDHVIKALALGADYVMIGSLFAQCLESAGEKYDGKHAIFDINDFKSLRIENGKVYGYLTEDAINELIAYASSREVKEYYKVNNSQYLRNEQYLGKCTVKFFGMASKDGQISISGEKTKTAEGITKYLPIEYTLKNWSENMISYLRSAMSYCNSFTLYEFIGEQILIPNSISEINAVNK